MSSSFINERSAEYILVPKFVEHLTQISTKITPIFFGLQGKEQLTLKARLKIKNY